MINKKNTHNGESKKNGDVLAKFLKGLRPLKFVGVFNKF